MPSRVMHPEWRASQAGTKYPFADSATLTNSAGRFIAEDAFLDLSIYAIGGQERMFLSRVIVTSSLITVYFGDAADKQRCNGRFNLASPPDNVELLDRYNRPAGLIVSRGELLAQLQALGLGTHDFLVTATEICASCVMPTPEQGVRGFILDDGTVLSGDVWMVGGAGVVLTHEQITRSDACGDTVTEQAVRVDVVGDPLFRRLLCGSADLFSTPRILTELRILHNCELVTTLTPDDQGNIRILVGGNLAADTTLRARTTTEGLQLEKVGSNA